MILKLLAMEDPTKIMIQYFIYYLKVSHAAKIFKHKNREILEMKNGYYIFLIEVK